MIKFDAKKVRARRGYAVALDYDDWTYAINNEKKKELPKGTKKITAREGIDRRRWGFGGTAVFLVAFLFSAPAFGHPAEVENIPSDRYFEVALNEIRQAKSSIRLTMYLIALPPKRLESKAYRLADALAQARERGVEVKVVLDGPGGFGDPTDKNDRAFRYLRERGVEVFYDDEKRLTHAKVLVIDGETVILGSTNWSEAALTRNVEANVLIRSKELAGEILSGFEELPVHAPAADGVAGPQSTDGGAPVQSDRR